MSSICSDWTGAAVIIERNLSMETANHSAAPIYVPKTMVINSSGESGIASAITLLSADVTLPSTVEQSATWMYDGQPENEPAVKGEEDVEICSRVLQLWTEQNAGSSAVKRGRAELKALRVALGAELHHLKQHLARTGRGGGWTPFLKKMKIPRTSADRFVNLHIRRLEQNANSPSGSISSLSAEQVNHYARTVAQRLRKGLVSQSAIIHFLESLRVLLEAPSDQDPRQV